MKVNSPSSPPGCTSEMPVIGMSATAAARSATYWRRGMLSVGGGGGGDAVQVTVLAAATEGVWSIVEEACSRRAVDIARRYGSANGVF